MGSIMEVTHLEESFGLIRPKTPKKVDEELPGPPSFGERLRGNTIRGNRPERF